jgi:hypothetical protein
MSTTTATFRDYNAENPELGTFSIRTDEARDTASILETWNGIDSDVQFTRDQARELGKRLIAWTGDEWAFMLHTSQEFEGAIGSLHVDIADGEPTLHVNDGPEFIASAEITHDMGVRLIAWAGVDDA